MEKFHGTKERKEAKKHGIKEKKLEECFDKEKVDEIKFKCGQPRRGKTYEEIYGKTKALGKKNFYRQRMLGKTYEELFGKEKAIEMKHNSSERFKGRNHPMFGIKSCDHPNWKGGRSFEPYCEEWRNQDLKDYIKDRDSYKCQNPQCENGDKLCVHHINYNKKDCDHSNLITLCCSCNSKANFQREWWQSFYTEIIRRKYIEEVIEK